MSPSFFKKTGTAAIHFKAAPKQVMNQYVQQLSSLGYVQWGTPIEFRVPMSPEGLRESAKQYAMQNGCALIIEIQDPNPQANPYNPYKFYLFAYQGGAYAPPEPPNPPAAAPQAPAQQGGQRQVAEFICPYCKSKFSSYVNPGRNMLSCPKCRGQCQVDIPGGPSASNLNQGPACGGADLSGIKLVGRYNTNDELIIDCLEVIGKILMVDGNPIPFADTGEFLYPHIRMKQGAYEHVGFRKMDMVLMKEAIHDFKIVGYEQHSHTQANVNPHKDELFAIKILGGVNFLVLEEFKALDDNQKASIANSFFAFLRQYVSTQS